MSDYSQYGLDTEKKSKDDDKRNDEQFCLWCNQHVTRGFYLCFSNWCICAYCAEQANDRLQIRWESNRECFKCGKKDTDGYRTSADLCEFHLCRDCISWASELLNDNVLNMARFKVSEQALEILKGCTVDGLVVKLPLREDRLSPNKLDRQLYGEVKKLLIAIGGKWKGGKIGGFVFEEDPTELLAAQANGEGKDLKQEFQFFETPEELAKSMLAFSTNIFAGAHANLRILEPSAGKGAIIKAMHKYVSTDLVVDCFELMDMNRMVLEKTAGANLIGKDFVESVKNDSHNLIRGQYDLIVANPPFNKNQDIEHIMAMYECLKTNGRIITIASRTWTFGSQKKQVRFREWLNKIEAHQEEVPDGTFKSSGTSVGAMLLVIDKLEVPTEKVKNSDLKERLSGEWQKVEETREALSKSKERYDEKQTIETGSKKHPTWEELFGKTIKDSTPEQRRENWLKFKNELPDDEVEMIEYWENTEGCTDRGVCVHKMDGEGWCNLQSLPCGYNPITKMLGMACMGTAYTPESELKKCRVCGCHDYDCRQCIAKTGMPCHWVEDDLCSACKDQKPKKRISCNGSNAADKNIISKNNNMSTIKINIPALLQALKKVKEIILKKPTLPVLSNVLLQMSGTQLKLIATDLEITVITIIELEEPGDDLSILLPFDFFYKTIELLIGDQVTITVKKNAVVIKGLNDVTDIKRLDNPADYPELPAFPDANKVSLTQEFIHSLEKSLATAATSQIQPIFSFVCVDFKEGAACIASTNASSLYIKSFEVENSEVAQLLIHPKVIRSLKGFEETTISWNDNHFLIQSGNNTIISKRSEQKFVNYMNVVPEAEVNLSLKKHELESALRMVSLTSDLENGATILLKSKIGTVVFEAKDEESNRSKKVELSGEYGGTCETIAILPDMLLSLLNQVDYEDISLSITAANKAILLKSDKDAGYTGLLMPIRPKDA